MPPTNRRACESGAGRTGGPITSSPAVADGRVYFNCNDGNFYALKSDTGTVQWRFKTGGERRFQAPGIHGTSPKGLRYRDPFDIFTSSPAVYQGCGPLRQRRRQRLRPSSLGVRCWGKFATKDVVHASPAVARGTVFIGSWDTYLYALDAATGRGRSGMKTAKIRRLTTRSVFNPRRRWSMTPCTSAAGTLIFMPSTPRRVTRNGPSLRKDLGSTQRPPCATASSTSRQSTAGCSTPPTRKRERCDSRTGPNSACSLLALAAIRN